jgi:hypothetical protein
MRTLAKVNENKNDNKPRTLGTLIDFKRGADNVAYGIVKENHNYFIKKSNNQANPNIEDFAYIGGLENIHEYRYNKLSEADKNRTMLLNTINEALSSKDNVIEEYNNNKQTLSEEEKKSNKKVNENAEEELAAAEEKLGNAEEKAEKEDEPEKDVDLDVDAIDLPTDGNGEEDGETPELPTDGNGDEAPELPTDGNGENDSETPEDDEEDIEVDKEVDKDVDKDVEIDTEDTEHRELQKLVGKITNKIRNTELTDSQVQSYLNSFITSFENKLPDLEVEERKEMANKIMKVDDKEKEELENTGIEDDTELGEEKTCETCGFAKYADSRGYDEESIMECGTDEMASLMNGYALQQESNLNEEDLQSMAVFSSPEIQECLTNEYGNDTLPESLKEYTENLNEQTSEDKKKKVKGMFWWKIKPQEKKDTTLKTLSEEDLSKYADMSDDELAKLDEETLNELNLAGLKNVGQYLKGKAGEKASAAAKGIEKGVKNVAGTVKSAITSKIDQATEKLDQLGNEIAQEYQKGVKSTVEKKLQKAAKEFGELIIKLDQAAQKAGEGPINRQQLIMQLQGVLKGKGMSETAFGNDPIATEVQPNMQEKEDYDEEQGEVPGEQDTGPDEYGDEEINSAEEFKEYANTVLKQAHGEDFDPEKAEYFIDGLTKMVNKNENEDWGAAVGILQQSLDESLNEQDEKDNGKEGEEDVELTPGFDAMDAGIPKPDSAGIESEEVNGEKEVEIKDSTVSINMNESEKKVRKYIRARLEEKAGIRKPSLNEDKKSDKIKTLDKMIDEQYDLFKSVINENENLDEIFGMSNAEKFKKLDPNNKEAINKTFNKIFSDTLSQYKRAREMANEMSQEDKYKVMKQGMETDKLTAPKFGMRNGEYVYLKHKGGSDFQSGGTGGKTTLGGV